LGFSLGHQLFKVYAKFFAQNDFLLLNVGNLHVLSFSCLKVTLYHIIVIFAKVFAAIDVNSAIDDLGVEKLHLQLDLVSDLEVLPMQSVNILEILIYALVQCFLTHFL